MNPIDSTIGKIASTVMRATSRSSRGEVTDLVIDHELPGVTPEMIDWWWDNIDSTERYILWHPQSHLEFKWERMSDEHVGRVQKVTEKIGKFPITLRIRWEDPTGVPVARVYEHANAGSILDNADRPVSWVMHQYESIPGGTKMRSTFQLPAKTPGWFVKALRRHNEEEMRQFTVFLPALYSGRD